jgi:hypothetical protein
MARDMDIRTTYFTSVIARDFFDLMAGEKIGHGIGRDVYACKIDKTLVLKIERASHSFQNVAEWELWDQLRETQMSKWLAPCVNISENGTILLMKRTMPIIPGVTKLPASAPRFLNDFKYQNFGIFQKHVVCHDYGRHNAVAAGYLTISKMKRVRFWDVNKDTRT